jgi:hypothetical protein
MYALDATLPIGNLSCQPTEPSERITQPGMSTATADQVVADTVEAAEAVFGAEIEAVYILGSLAHGGFAPLVSDVDVAIVLASTGPDTAGRIDTVRNWVVEKAAHPLSARLSLFWADWRAVRTGEGDHFRLGPVDRLDLLDSGRLLIGSDLRGPGVRPSSKDLVLMSADFILAKFTEAYFEQLRDTKALVAGGPRAVTKAILFPVRFMYTLKTGRAGLNHGSAHWYAAEGLPGGGLAVTALEWRNEGIADHELAVQLVEADLATVHAVCLTEYATELNRLGEAGRADALAERAGCVDLVTQETR